MTTQHPCVCFGQGSDPSFEVVGEHNITDDMRVVVGMGSDDYQKAPAGQACERALVPLFFVKVDNASPHSLVSSRVIQHEYAIRFGALGERTRDIMSYLRQACKPIPIT